MKKLWLFAVIIGLLSMAMIATVPDLEADRNYWFPYTSDWWLRPISANSGIGVNGTGPSTFNAYMGSDGTIKAVQFQAGSDTPITSFTGSGLAMSGGILITSGGGGTTYSASDGVALTDTNFTFDGTLDEVGNPATNKTFTMGNNELIFTYTAPTTGDGAFEIEATGGFDGDLVHIHQHTGSPVAGVDLLHLEASGANVLPLRITSANATAISTNAGVKIGGTLDMGENSISNLVNALNDDGVAMKWGQGTYYITMETDGRVNVYSSRSMGWYADTSATAFLYLSNAGTGDFNLKIQSAFTMDADANTVYLGESGDTIQGAYIDTITTTSIVISGDTINDFAGTGLSVSSNTLVVGTAPLATALAADPIDCSAGSVVQGISAAGVPVCVTASGGGNVLADGSVPFTGTVEISNAAPGILFTDTGGGDVSLINNNGTLTYADYNAGAGTPTTRMAFDDVSGPVIMFSPQSTGASHIIFAEDSDNGSSLLDLKAPADLSGNISVSLPSSAGTVALVGGNVATATALAADPIDCSAGSVVQGISAAGVPVCVTASGGGDVLADGSVPFTGDVTISKDSPLLKLDSVSTNDDWSFTTAGSIMTFNNYVAGSSTPTIAFNPARAPSGYGYTLQIHANATGPSALFLGEDYDNGTSTIGIVAPSALGSNRILTLPDATGTIALTSDIVISSLGDAAAAFSIDLENNKMEILNAGTTVFYIDSTNRVYSLGGFFSGVADGQRVSNAENTVAYTSTVLEQGDIGSTSGVLYFSEDGSAATTVALAGGAFHDGFSDFVSAEHVTEASIDHGTIAGLTDTADHPGYTTDEGLSAHAGSSSVHHAPVAALAFAAITGSITDAQVPDAITVAAAGISGTIDSNQAVDASFVFESEMTSHEGDTNVHHAPVAALPFTAITGSVQDAQIVATIARDSEVTTAVSDHAALGSIHLPTDGTSGQIAAWNDTTNQWYAITNSSSSGWYSTMESTLTLDSDEAYDIAESGTELGTLWVHNLKYTGAAITINTDLATLGNSIGLLGGTINGSGGITNLTQDTYPVGASGGEYSVGWFNSIDDGDGTVDMGAILAMGSNSITTDGTVDGVDISARDHAATVASDLEVMGLVATAGTVDYVVASDGANGLVWKIDATGSPAFITTMTGDLLAGGTYQITGLQAPDTAGDAIRATTDITEAALIDLTDGGETAEHTHAGGAESSLAGTNMSLSGNTLSVVDNPSFASTVTALNVRSLSGFVSSVADGEFHITFGNTNDYSGTLKGAVWFNGTGGVMRYHSAASTAQTVANVSQLFGGNFTDLAGSASDAQIPDDITISALPAANITGSIQDAQIVAAIARDSEVISYGSITGGWFSPAATDDAVWRYQATRASTIVALNCEATGGTMTLTFTDVASTVGTIVCPNGSFGRKTSLTDSAVAAQARQYMDITSITGSVSSFTFGWEYSMP